MRARNTPHAHIKFYSPRRVTVFFLLRAATKFNFHMNFSRIALITASWFSICVGDPVPIWQCINLHSSSMCLFEWFTFCSFAWTSDHPSIDGFIITLSLPSFFSLPFPLLWVCVCVCASILSFFLLLWCHLLILCLHSIHFTVVICSMAIKEKLARILRGLMAVLDRTCLCS